MGECVSTSQAKVEPSIDSALLVDSIPAGVVVVSGSGTIVFANHRAREILPTASVGANIATILAPLDTLRRAQEGDRASLSYYNPRDQKEVAVGYSFATIKHADCEECHVLLCQDISDVVRLQSERDKLLQIAAVGEVLPAILHELKNPLAAVRSTVELLIEETPASQTRDDLYTVLGELRRMSLMLDGVGSIERDLASTRLNAIDQACREAFFVMKAQAVDKGVELQADIAHLPLLPFHAAGFRTIVFNLVKNALDASRQGDRIALAVTLHNAELRVSVSDTGQGMTPDVLAKCRQLFFTTKNRGSGIGLALCQTLAESVEGTVEIASEQHKGTTVTVCVPVENTSQLAFTREA